MADRIDKILTAAMVGSRKDVTKLIRSGLVTVDDNTVTSADLKIEPGKCKIQVNGKSISYKEHYYIMLNKPQGVISATEDKREKTVIDLISNDYPKNKLFPAGRLDKDTEGFLFLTTDGILAHKVTGPKDHVEKVYYAETDKPIPESLIEKFKTGVILEDGYICKPAKLEIKAKKSCNLTISEGKFHQVKRMFLAYDITVTYLKRIKIGGVPLDEMLELGQYRELTCDEVARLI